MYWLSKLESLNITRLFFISHASLFSFKKLSVSLPLSDFKKRQALKDKTGFDCDAALRHVEEEKEDEGENTILKTGERRVKKEEAEIPERRTTPKYNVVSVKKEDEEAKK